MRGGQHFRCGAGTNGSLRGSWMRGRVHDVLHVAVYVPEPFVPAVIAQPSHGGLNTPSWFMIAAMSSAAHSSLMRPSRMR